MRTESAPPGPPRGPNPLLADRPALEAEALRLCVDIAHDTGGELDASEVLSNASEFKGRRAVNLANMRDDWFLHTLHTLRRERRRQLGQPEDGQATSALSAENRQRVSGIAQWLEERQRARAVEGGGGAA